MPWPPPAVAAGERRLRTLLIFTPTNRAVLPCGACRQVLREFADDMVVISLCDGGGRLEMRLSELLPRAFGAQTLEAKGAQR